MVINTLIIRTEENFNALFLNLKYAKGIDVIASNAIISAIILTYSLLEGYCIRFATKSVNEKINTTKTKTHTS